MRAGQVIPCLTILSAAARSRRERFHQGALGGPGGMGIEPGVQAEQRGAIGADGFARIAHIDEHMGMVEGRLLSHAHELMGADLDHRHPRSVVEMGNDVLRHRGLLGAPGRGSASPCCRAAP